MQRHQIAPGVLHSAAEGLRFNEGAGWHDYFPTVFFP
jgi:hypothetical protein